MTNKTYQKHLFFFNKENSWCTVEAKRAELMNSYIRKHQPSIGKLQEFGEAKYCRKQAGEKFTAEKLLELAVEMGTIL